MITRTYFGYGAFFCFFFLFRAGLAQICRMCVGNFNGTSFHRCSLQVAVATAAGQQRQKAVNLGWKPGCASTWDFSRSKDELDFKNDILGIF